MAEKQTDEKKPALPAKSNFSEWYNELLLMGEIMDVRYPVKGLYVWFPFGFEVRKLTYAIIRELLDKDHKEALFPLLIPETEFMKEAEHIKGFENEVYWVTHGGKNELDVKLALRPTSETAIYPMYKVWVRSHADLPIRIYQIVNTFRYETKHTRPLIRLREITSFKEAHTVHATWDEAAGHIGNALVGVVNLLNLRLIVIGGGVSNNYGFLGKRINATIKARAMRVQAGMVKVVRAKLRDDAGILGAQVLVKESTRGR